MLSRLRKNGADLKRLRTDKQRRFVLEYVLLRAKGRDSPKQAAINAGYPARTAAQMAQKLLKNPVVGAYIGKLERQDVEKLQLSRHEVLLQVWYAATREVRDFVDLETGLLLLPHCLPDRCQTIVDGFEQDITEYVEKDGTTVRQIKMKYKLTPHAAAREQWLKHKGLMVPEEHNVNISVQRDFLAELAQPRRLNAVTRRLEQEQKSFEHEGAK